MILALISDSLVSILLIILFVIPIRRNIALNSKEGLKFRGTIAVDKNDDALRRVLRTNLICSLVAISSTFLVMSTNVVIVGNLLMQNVTTSCSHIDLMINVGAMLFSTRRAWKGGETQVTKEEHINNT